MEIGLQHVGSTSIQGIKAKPIIDIAVSVKDFCAVTDRISILEQSGFLLCKWSDHTQLLLVCGDNSSSDGFVTHLIYIVKTDSLEWKDYLRFRDYLNTFPSVAKEYELLKVRLAAEYPDNPKKYFEGKHNLIQKLLRKAQTYAFLGTMVMVTIDRQLGSHHPEHSEIIYPVNYGYLSDEIAPDGEELDAYVLGEDKPMDTFYGRVIAIIHRMNDEEDKLVVAPESAIFSKDEIQKAVQFQEQYFQSYIELEK